MKQENIRNFSIIAHIDHGKSTLADRILEKTGALSAREMKDQFLDSMDLERERGITIKLNSVSLKYKYNNEEYLLNLIDTPGHVDFSYEVSRSLAACEGAILVVDATQGIEAQTLANLYLALEDNLTIIPVINKIDLPNANIPLVKESLIKTLGFKDEDIILCSGKTGEGVEDLLESVIKNIPAPQNHDSEPLSALVFDSYFDSYKGVVGLIKVEKGVLKVKDKIKFFTSNKEYEVVNIFKHNPKEEEVNTLRSGEVGYFVGSIKDLLEIKVGDTLTHIDNPCKERIKGYKEMKPMVYSGVFPIEPNKYDALKEAFDKLKLNDASLTIEKESSTSLGFGFRVGFLGLLHMDVIKERLEQEFGLNIIITSPSVIYKCYLTNKEVLEIDNPNLLPNMENIAKIEEPYIYTSILVPANYVGGIMTLCQNKRGIYKNIEYITSDRCNIHYEIPLGEIVYDFYDKLKSITEGYASFDYDLIGYKESKLVKLDIMLNGEKVDALSSIVHKDFAYERGRKITEKLRTIIPRGLFQINIQASIGSKVIARETLSPMKKNVLAKCYGGDISRKRKLLEKQKEGKKRMKMLGTVEVPSEAFIDILSE